MWAHGEKWVFPQEVDVDAIPSPVVSPVLLACPRSLCVSHHLETVHSVTLSPLLLTLGSAIFLSDICVKGLKVTWKKMIEDSYGTKEDDFSYICSALSPDGGYHQQLLGPEVRQRLQPSCIRNWKSFRIAPGYTLNVNVWFLFIYLFIFKVLLFRGPWRRWRAGGSVAATCRPHEDRSSQANY